MRSSVSVRENTPEEVSLSSGMYVQISSSPLIISAGRLPGTFRATYLSDGSYHEPFRMGDYYAKPLPEGSLISITVGKKV